MAPVNKNTLVAACILTVATSAQSLLTTGSKNARGKYDYNVATVPLLAELLKLLASSVMLYNEYSRNPKALKMTTDWRSVMLFPIPSIIYLGHHSITFPLLAYVDPSTYQILGNLKIVTTGLAAKLILGRRLSQLKWLALVLLTLGATVSQIAAGKGDGLFAAPPMGYMLGVLNALLSAVAGVYTEFLMKKNDDSLHWQNIQLYSFGVFFNVMRLTIEDISDGFHNGFWPVVMFDGYSFITYLVVANLAFSGLMVSFIMKYADTIAKVFATSMAMMLTPFAAYFLFDLKPSIALILGIVIACMAVHLYYANPKDLVEVREIPSSLRSVDSGSAQSLRTIESNSSVGLAQRNKGNDSSDSLLATSTNAIAEG
mmetsp:Transcript_31111/g.52260  ORF Transcript_31111/g.52260 Transcript_31111/m.52260 type:complete len:371 (+) Transcript_31111:321-1433(+)